MANIEQNPIGLRTAIPKDRFAQIGNVSAIYKLQKENVAYAMASASKNDTDEVFYRVGKDTFVAMGRGLTLTAVPPGVTFTLDGKVATVIAVDHSVLTPFQRALGRGIPYVGGTTFLGFSGGALYTALWAGQPPIVWGSLLGLGVGAMVLTLVLMAKGIGGSYENHPELDMLELSDPTFDMTASLASTRSSRVV